MDKVKKRRVPVATIIFSLILLIVLMSFGNFLTGLIVSIVLVSVATIVEFNKRLLFGNSFPISVELMSVSVMFATVKFGLNWGLFVAIAGITILVVVRRYFCAGTMVRAASLIILALLSSTFSPIKWYVSLLIVHNMLQWVAYVGFLGNNFVTASIARASNVILNVFVFKLMLNWV
jgi:hypothetical protein